MLKNVLTPHNVESLRCRKTFLRSKATLYNIISKSNFTEIYATDISLAFISSFSTMYKLFRTSRNLSRESQNDYVHGYHQIDLTLCFLETIAELLQPVKPLPHDQFDECYQVRARQEKKF